MSKAQATIGDWVALFTVSYIPVYACTVVLYISLDQI